MRTQDIINTGIDRNFLRKCMSEKIIVPQQEENKLINQQYRPYVFSQEDLETVWNAYLCLKMGLSFPQIKKLLHGEEFSIRESINGLIQEYQSKIEELHALIEFMKYVKGVGFIPTPPQTSLGSNTFTEYLYDFIAYLDRDKRIMQVLNVADFFSNLDNIEEAADEDIEKIEAIANELNPSFSDTDRSAFVALFVRLSEKMQLAPESTEIQNIVNELYCYQKKLSNNPHLTAGEFACNYIFMLSQDSDLSVMYKKMLEQIHEGVFDYFLKALVHFLILQEPSIVAKIINETKEESNGD